MQHTCIQLIERIEKAFESSEYPGDQNLVPNPEHCAEHTATQDFFRGRSWRELAKASVKLPAHWADMCFLTPEAWRFFLPAYMIQALSMVSSIFRDNTYVTDKDGAPSYQSMENIIVHELAHNSLRLSQDSTASDQRFYRLYTEMGWEHERLSTGEDRWSLKGKDGYRYMRLDPNRSGMSRWFRLTADGRPLGKDGKIVTNINLAAVSNNEVLKQSRILPVGGDVEEPEEIIVDGLAWFRSGEKRGYLLTHSPELYKIAKEIDQEEIDERYGKTPLNMSMRIRSVPGELVPPLLIENRLRISKNAV